MAQCIPQFMACMDRSPTRYCASADVTRMRGMARAMKEGGSRLSPEIFVKLQVVVQHWRRLIGKAHPNPSGTCLPAMTAETKRCPVLVEKHDFRGGIHKRMTATQTRMFPGTFHALALGFHERS